MPEEIEVTGTTLAELYRLLDYEHGTTLGKESEEVNGYRAVASQHIENSRWMERYLLVFRRVSDGQLYAVEYQLGLTECQPNELPWEDYGMVECFPVSATTKTIVKTVYQ